MGTPKLLLPLGGRLVIDYVLSAWTASRVTRTVVVARADDAPLLARCRLFDVDLVTPATAPPDMRASVEHALAHIADRFAPSDIEVWIVAPADLPRLAPSVIDFVLQAYNPRQPSAIAPVHGGERGHPTLLPWSTAREVRNLAAGEGINSLVARTPLREIECPEASVLDDLDAPADYAQLAAEWGPAQGGETAGAPPGF